MKKNISEFINRELNAQIWKGAMGFARLKKAGKVKTRCFPYFCDEDDELTTANKLKEHAEWKWQGDVAEHFIWYLLDSCYCEYMHNQIISGHEVDIISLKTYDIFDVKASSKTREVKCHVDNIHASDYIIKCIVTDDTVEYLGFISTKELKATGNLINGCYTVKEDKLNKNVTDLIVLIKGGQS